VECEFLISAPKGKIIKLDFRGDFFELEPTDRADKKCEETNDYLEVRDGPHGYSTLKGRFCGTQFPEPIISSDRYLWLSFKTDANLEKRGFQGVFTFINNTGNHVTQELQHRQHISFDSFSNCFFLSSPYIRTDTQAEFLTGKCVALKWVAFKV
jgi:hypothetical protein